MRTRGIYILGNDAVFDQVAALVRSIRIHDALTPICLIPYREDVSLCEAFLRERNGFILGDSGLLEQAKVWEQRINTEIDWKGQDMSIFLGRMRKLLTFFGPFDDFLYLDADIVVFQRVADFFPLLETYDFLPFNIVPFTEHQQWIFKPPVRHLLSDEQLQKVFNTGFWFGRKDAVSAEDIDAAIDTVCAHPDCFFVETIDSPVINYLVLTRVRRLSSLTQLTDVCRAGWAGMPNLDVQGGVLHYKDRPLMFLHWAGFAMDEHMPYREVWERFASDTSPMIEESTASYARVE